MASVTQSSAASVPPGEAAPKPATEQPAATPVVEKPAAAVAPVESDEPLPNIVFTPPSELRTSSRAKFNAALAAIKKLTTPSAAIASLTRSLGKPTWIEDEKVRVWVTREPTECVRIVVQDDGGVDFEVMRFTESKTISRSARQNLCSGEIEKAE